ncbi:MULTISPECIES: SixA phosphatase family protein [Deefgea]|uniref:Histidine phosphatase family protein n=1 Tax=Deefgea chitinilytica TaxID=570276 RepID=A0ABS2CE31_9NEIS|nr:MULTISPECIES: histidine phosphatase family protein [Deefgea]MBM5572390.1 histidine phosphatase family protein [Deefgea chitinilytica]MBM9889626.1 histidine phosphatase family protein [Deefgea sp. CFH1-16]
MDLILWRHADAEYGVDDLARPLTPKGVKQAKKVAAWLRRQLKDVAGYRLIASEAVRSQATAQYLNPQYEINPKLNPGCHNACYLEAARWPRDIGKFVVIVGHQPNLGEVASLLVTGKELDWNTRKGGIWWIQRRVMDDGRVKYVLKAALSPDLL